MRRILNVGCGTSIYGTHFVDLYPERSGVKKVDVDYQKLPYPNSYFNEVFSENMFEHLTNPGFFLKESYRVLKKGGRIVVITDNANYYGWVINGVHRGLYERFRMKCPGDRHYALFTDWHLKNHLRKVGFQRIKIEYVPYKLPTIEGVRFVLLRFGFFLVFILNKLLALTPLFRIGNMRIRGVGIKK